MKVIRFPHFGVFMHILRLKIENYRAFIDPGDIVLDPHITVITGKNNVGKSVLLKLLTLFGRSVLNSQQLLPRFEGYLDEEPRIQINLRLRTDEFLSFANTTPSRCKEDIQSIPGPISPPVGAFLNKAIELVAPNQDLDIIGEFALPLSIPSPRSIGNIDPLCGSWFIKRISIGDVGFVVKGYWTTTDRKDPVMGVNVDSPATNLLLSYRPILSIIDAARKTFLELNKRIYYFGPHRVPSPGQAVIAEHAEDLLPDASNLRQVVFTLFTNRNTHPDDDFPQLEKFVSSVFPEIANIRTPIMPAREEEYGKGITVSGPHVTATDIKFIMAGNPPAREDLWVSMAESGTGVEQILALTTKIITSKEPHLLLIDEPHAFLHPDAERKLITFLQKHKHHQYIIATNSPVILNAVCPEAVRLVVREDNNSKIKAISKENIEDVVILFQELGLRRSDIWHSDKIIWTEGPTEESVLPLILEAIGLHPELSGVRIIGLRHASLFTNAKPTTKRTVYETVKFITETLTPLPPDYKFLFDLNEKTPDEQKRIQEIAPGRVIFSDRREIENYLLDPELIHEVISEEMEEPISKEPFMRKFSSLINNIEDKKLYPEKPDKADLLQIKGSALLDEIYQEYLKREYHKIRDGIKLASGVGEKSPTNFDFFKKTFSDFITC